MKLESSMEQIKNKREKLKRITNDYKVTSLTTTISNNNKDNSNIESTEQQIDTTRILLCF